MKYLVKFEKCNQVGPDTWRIEWVECIFDETNTMSEIHDWIQGQLRIQDKMKMVFPDVKISIPQNLNKL